MKQSRKKQDQFEDQLQGKLNLISQRKSNKKLKNKSSHLYQQPFINQIDYSVQPHKNNGQFHHYQEIKQNNISPSSASNKYPNKIQHLQSEQNTEEKQKQSSQFTTISNKQLYNFLSNFQSNSSTIDLSYFLAKSLAIYSPQPNLSQQQIKQIFLLLQTEITTTNPNIISINALELAIKKKGGSFKMYIIDKIMEGKLIVQGNKIIEKQKNIQKTLYETEENLKNKQKQLYEKQKLLNERQKILIKKQKQNNNKQKQLIQRIKNSKKILQERSQKLIEQHISQLNIIYQKIQKKIQNYERNYKNKIQKIGQKLNNLNKLKQIKQIDIKNILIKQIQIKYQKLYINKIKKYQNDLNQSIKKQQSSLKFIKQLQNQKKSLTKLCNKLQNKIIKQQNKFKQLFIQLSSKIQQINQLKFILQKKNKQNQQIINQFCKINQSNHKKNDHCQNPPHEQTRNIKQSTISTSKSKKSLSSKKKNSNHKENTTTLSIEEVVDIYELALETSPKQLKIEGENYFTFLKQMLEMSTKLYLNHQKQCKQLIKLIYQKTITSINNNLIKYKQSNNNNHILSFLAQMQSCCPRESAQIIYKYYNNLHNKNNKYKQEIKLWKFFVIFCLLSSNWQSSYYWLKAISEVWQNGEVENQMRESISSSQKQFNFMLAIIVKLFVPHHSVDLNVLNLVSEMVLNMKLVGEQAYSQFWHSNNIGILLIKDYTSIVRNILQNEVELSQDQMQQIERVSILIQRLVVGYNIIIKTQYCQYFDRLRRKCKGSLLQKNLNSILENYDTKTEEILKQLDDV